MFYGSQCRASAICSSSELDVLDSVLVCKAQMSLRSGHITSVEAVLPLAVIVQVGIQIARLLSHYYL